MKALKDIKCLHFHVIMMFRGKKTGYIKEATVAEMLPMQNINKGIFCFLA